MVRRWGSFFLFFLGWLVWPAACAMTVRVENLAGNIRVRSVAGDKVEVRRSSPTRETRPDDARITQGPDLVLVKCAPADGARVDLDILVPYAVNIEASTAAGEISFTGLVQHFSLSTESGDIRLAVPWKGMRLDMAATRKPMQLSAPRDVKFSASESNGAWTLRKGTSGEAVYGMIRALAGSPRQIDLVDIPVPDDSPVKFPWQAPAILQEILRKPVQTNPSAPKGQAAWNPEGTPLFVSDVRMVNLSVSVRDKNGLSIPDLKPGDFEVHENGVLQQVAVAESEKVPFNLALLLDLSGSTTPDRVPMKEATRRFIGIARPQDRVAVYAMADDLFYVVSPLTEDRQRLLNLVDAIPDVTGGTPLYGAIALAYAEEFARRGQERNALIVISDGVDGGFDQRLASLGTWTTFPLLQRAAPEMSMLVYPIFLGSENLFYGGRARKQMEDLASLSGGRLFAARSIHDLEPVYAQVADELSTVYSVAYYPRNQNFDGAFRRVEVKVKRSGAKLRTRAGYSAW